MEFVPPNVSLSTRSWTRSSLSGLKYSLKLLSMRRNATPAPTMRQQRRARRRRSTAPGRPRDWSAIRPGNGPESPALRSRSASRGLGGRSSGAHHRDHGHLDHHRREHAAAGEHPEMLDHRNPGAGERQEGDDGDQPGDDHHRSHPDDGLDHGLPVRVPRVHAGGQQPAELLVVTLEDLDGMTGGDGQHENWAWWCSADPGARPSGPSGRGSRSRSECP